MGVLGPTGRGTPEHCGVAARIDVLTGTLGKALGGASGGYVSGRWEIVELLRQRARPYLFSNSLVPAVTAASIKALEIVSRSAELCDRLAAHTRFFRAEWVVRRRIRVPGSLLRQGFAGQVGFRIPSLRFRRLSFASLRISSRLILPL